MDKERLERGILTARFMVCAVSALIVEHPEILARILAEYPEFKVLFPPGSEPKST